MCFRAERDITMRLRRRKARQVAWKVVYDDPGGSLDMQSPYYYYRYKVGRRYNLKHLKAPHRKFQPRKYPHPAATMGRGLYAWRTQKEALLHTRTLYVGREQQFKVLKVTYLPRDIIGADALNVCVRSYTIPKHQPKVRKLVGFTFHDRYGSNPL